MVEFTIFLEKIGYVGNVCTDLLNQNYIFVMFF